MSLNVPLFWDMPIVPEVYVASVHAAYIMFSLSLSTGKQQSQTNKR